MVYYCTEYDPTDLIRNTKVQKRRKGNQGSRKTNFSYKDIICAFDIETSLYQIGSHDACTARNQKVIDDYVAIMYIWQMQLGLDVTVYGRTWEEFNAFMRKIVDAVMGDERLVIFVHNLAYEWQWLRDDYVLGQHINEESVFCVKSRTPIKFTCFGDKIEYRCSYIHSNMSLDEFTAKMGVQHQKLSGDEFDYSAQRFSWTPLTDRQLEYCYNDVIGLVECLYKECEVDGDNLYTLPLTSTGYVRRDIKKAIQKLPYGYMQKQLPDYSQYRMLREAFRGGNTHASRYYTNHRLDADIYCNDISSSYPNVLLNCKFPVTPFSEIKQDCCNIDHIVNLIKKGKAVMMRIGMWNVQLSDPLWGVPYLSKDKCREIFHGSYDNGRILSADYLETTITDVDLGIILDEYDGDIEIIDAQFATYGYLPDAIRDVIRDYYRRKTALKGVDAEIVQYNKVKAKINACYGMAAQNPVRLEEIYQDHNYKQGIKYHDDDHNELFMALEYAETQGIDIYEIAHRENIDHSTMPYQWGVWCTAWARRRLEDAIKICGNDFVYCDTDSVYYIGEKDFSAYNDARIADSKSNYAYAEDRKGKMHYMGVMELDKHVKAFKTMGAKKYAYIDLDDQLHITIAGVSKEKGAEELTAAAHLAGMQDGLSAMQVDFVFEYAGGTESVYNDDGMLLEIDDRTVYVPSNVAIKPSTYKVGLSDDYASLLEKILDHGLFALYRLNYDGAQLPTLYL